MKSKIDLGTATVADPGEDDEAVTDVATPRNLNIAFIHLYIEAYQAYDSSTADILPYWQDSVTFRVLNPN